VTNNPQEPGLESLDGKVDGGKIDGGKSIMTPPVIAGPGVKFRKTEWKPQ
jgi:hypothetical protein